MKVITWDKNTITQPGLYAGVPIWLYHERYDQMTGELRWLCDKPSISSSGLRTIFSDSLADYWDTSPYNKRAAEDGDAEHFVLGRALHHLALGEPNFKAHFVLRPEKYMGSPWNGNRTDCKEWLGNQSRAGLTVITTKQLANLKGMLEVLGRNAMFREGILGGLVEHTLIAKHEPTGFYVRSRPDSIPTASGDFADLKSTRSVHEADLQTAIYDYGYHQQAALTHYCAKQVLGLEMSSYALIFVQSERPWSVRVVQLKPNDLERGWEQNGVALEMFARSMKSGIWPGPGGERADAEYIELSERHQKRIDDRLAYLRAQLKREEITAATAKKGVARR